MTAHIVKKAVLLPEHTAECKRHDNRTLLLGDVPDTTLDIGETCTLFGNECRSILLLPNELSDGINPREHTLDTLRRTRGENSQSKIAQALHLRL